MEGERKAIISFEMPHFYCQGVENPEIKYSHESMKWTQDVVQVIFHSYFLILSSWNRTGSTTFFARSLYETIQTSLRVPFDTVHQ